MGRPKQSIDSLTLSAIEKAITQVPNGDLVRKLTILSSFSWMKATDISSAYGINIRTLFRWIEQFKKNGVDGLRNNPKGHKPAILHDTAKKAIAKWITTQCDEDGNQVYWTLDKLRGELYRVFSLKISKPSLSINLKKMKIAEGGNFGD